MKHNCIFPFLFVCFQMLYFTSFLKRSHLSQMLSLFIITLQQSHHLTSIFQLLLCSHPIFSSLSVDLSNLGVSQRCCCPHSCYYLVSLFLLFSFHLPPPYFQLLPNFLPWYWVWRGKIGIICTLVSQWLHTSRLASSQLSPRLFTSTTLTSVSPFSFFYK